MAEGTIKDSIRLAANATRGRFLDRAPRPVATPPIARDPLESVEVRKAMRLAWEKLETDDPAERRVAGGYLARKADGTYGVLRWPDGDRSTITPPPLEPGRTSLRS